jgi:hypothetical protein
VYRPGVDRPALPHLQQAVRPPQHSDYRLILARAARPASSARRPPRTSARCRSRHAPRRECVKKPANWRRWPARHGPGLVRRACTTLAVDPACLMGAARASSPWARCLRPMPAQAALGSLRKIRTCCWAWANPASQGSRRKPWKPSRPRSGRRSAADLIARQLLRQSGKPLRPWPAARSLPHSDGSAWRAYQRVRGRRGLASRVGSRHPGGQAGAEIGIAPLGHRRMARSRTARPGVGEP